MRILLSYARSELGGVETWMAGLAQAFQADGHECELFFFSRGPFASAIPGGLTAHFGNLADFVRLVEARQFDVVQSASIDYDLGVAAARKLGAKVVLHGNGWVHPAWNTSNCDALVGCANWNAQAQQKLTDVQVEVIRNGVSVTQYPFYDGPVKGPPIVAWVGRGSALNQKQIDKVAAVAPYLRAGGARLWLADPDGPEKVPAEAARVLKGMAERWESVPPGAMRQFYHDVVASGGCLLSTSRFEGLSLAYLEAQACGCPVIGPDVIGVNESLDVALGGVLYSAEISAEKLGALVLATVGDAGKMRWRREASRRFVVENCSFEKTAREYLRVYAASPEKGLGGWRKIRARLACSPFVHWKEHVKSGWGAGSECYLASEQLQREGNNGLARVMLGLAVRTAPTMFIRRRRLVHAMKVMLNQGTTAALPAGSRPVDRVV